MAAVNLSTIFDKLGNPGWFQVIFCFCIVVSNSIVANNHLLMAVFGFTPPHSCNIPDGYSKNQSLPLETINGKLMYSECNIYKDFNASTGEIIPCPSSKGWEFSLDGEESTIVNEWSLVCDRKYQTPLSTTIYFIGVMLGGAVFGQLGDIFGRKPIILVCLYAPIPLGIGVYFSNSYEMFTVLRFFIGFFVQGLQTNGYVLMAEMTKKKYLSLVAGLFEIFWALGTFWLGSISWFIQDWRNIQLILSLSCLVTISFIVFLPESVLWLINKNKIEEAKKTLQKIARFNRKTLTDEDLAILQKSNVNGTEKYSFYHLVKTPAMRKRTLLMCYLWLASSAGYYGLSLAVGGLGGNRYVNQFISSFVELVAFSSVIFILKFCRRRYPMMACYILGGVTCIVSSVIKSENKTGGQTTATVFAFIGKLGFTTAFATIFLFTVELFPTVVRTLGVGTCVFWARVGGVIAPQILLLGKYTFDELPYIIFGSLSLLAAVVVYFVPETFGKNLPNTIEEIEGTTVKDNKVELSDYYNHGQDN